MNFAYYQQKKKTLEIRKQKGKGMDEEEFER